MQIRSLQNTNYSKNYINNYMACGGALPVWIPKPAKFKLYGHFLKYDSCAIAISAVNEMWEKKAHTIQ